MKTPALLGPDGRTSLREYAGYHGGGHGFGGQLRGWQPQSESPDAALCEAPEGRDRNVENCIEGLIN